MNYRSKIFLLTGLYALIAVFIARQLILSNSLDVAGSSELPLNMMEFVIFSMGLLTFVLVLITIALIVKRKTNPLSFKKRFNFLIPSLLGWMIIFLMLQQNMHDLVIPTSIIIFGLILLNLNRFVTSRLVFFGISLIALGVLAFFFPDNNYLFVSLGFGIFPIVFGLILLRKPDPNMET